MLSLVINEVIFFFKHALKWVQIFLSVPKSCHNVTLFLSFLPSLFLPCKDTFMDDYDGI